MSAFEVRLAGEADSPQLVEPVLAFRDHLGAARPARERLAAFLPTLLADPASELGLALARDGTALGYVYLRFYLELWASGIEGHIEDLFVVETARRLGVGGRLLDLALERAEARGAQAVGLHTNEHNTTAQRLYRRAGFQPRREERWDGGREVYWVRGRGAEGPPTA